MLSCRPIRPYDVLKAQELLHQNSLPLEGFPKDTAIIFGAYHADDLVGCAGLEIHGDYALLRSVVVEQGQRGKGIGKALTHALIAKARQETLHGLYLLTTTAEPFFSRLGFQVISRSTVPGEVKRSVEFQSACPETATVMSLDLPEP